MTLAVKEVVTVQNVSARAVCTAVQQRAECRALWGFPVVRSKAVQPITGAGTTSESS